MNRIVRISLAVALLSVMVIFITYFASDIINPNQRTPIRKLVPNVNSQPVELQTDKVVAAWVWEYPTQVKNYDNLIDQAKREGINTLYIYIDEYIDIYELPVGAVRAERLEKYNNVLISALTKAKEENISVHALSGNPAYGYDSHSYIPPILLEHIFEFNRQNPDTQFDGIQFDIEFYDDERFFDSTQEYMDFYLTMVDDIAQKTKQLNELYEDNLRLGWVIPFWFDDPNNDYMKEPIFGEIVESLSILENPYIVIMSYRNIVDGDDGVIAISEGEFKETKDTPVKIVIAQEVSPNEETKITHYGKTRNEIKNALKEILEKESKYANFEGVALHDLDAFLKTN